MSRDYFIDRIVKQTSGIWKIYLRQMMSPEHGARLHHQIMIGLGMKPSDASKFNFHGVKSWMPTKLIEMGVSTTQMMIVCRWKSPTMPLKYARHTGGLTINLVNQMVKDFEQGWEPAPSVEAGIQARG